MSTPSKPPLPAKEPTYDPTRPFPSVVTLYNTKIPHTVATGKSIVALQVTFAPNGSTPPHTHAGAFLSAYVVSGYVLNKVNDDPMKVFGPGEQFVEHPGCRHRISDNVSTTESAQMVATLIVDTSVVEKNGVAGLVVIDEEYREMVKEAREKAAAAAKDGKS